MPGIKWAQTEQPGGVATRLLKKFERAYVYSKRGGRVKRKGDTDNHGIGGHDSERGGVPSWQEKKNPLAGIISARTLE